MDTFLHIGTSNRLIIKLTKAIMMTLCPFTTNDMKSLHLYKYYTTKLAKYKLLRVILEIFTILKLVNCMNGNAKYLKKSFQDNPDFVLREIESGTKDKIYLAFFESLVDSANIADFVIKNVRAYLNLNKKIKDLKPILGGPKLSDLTDSEEMFYHLENGFVVILHKDKIFAIEAKANLDRGVTMSQTEPNMYGPKDAFCENYQKNVGLIKRRIKNKNLKIESVDRGVYTKTKIGVIYIDDKVDKTALEKTQGILNKFKDTEVIDSYDIVKELENSAVFPTILKTETPAIVARYLLKGYIVLTIDNTPFVLVLNARFRNFINPFTTDDFVRVLRYLCLFLTVLTPAIYIALINFDQEAIPTSLLISFSEQRSGVPFPAIVEAVIMLVICEVLRESDIRFPSNYGSSASILGALILGEAAVSAGFVSPIMIIVVAISFISSLIFTQVKLVNALRVMRFVFLLVASFLGLYGLSMTIIAFLAMMTNVQMNEGNYL